jgi:hypothetical protein
MDPEEVGQYFLWAAGPGYGLWDFTVTSDIEIDLISSLVPAVWFSEYSVGHCAVEEWQATIFQSSWMRYRLSRSDTPPKIVLEVAYPTELVRHALCPEPCQGTQDLEAI